MSGYMTEALLYSNLFRQVCFNNTFNIKSVDATITIWCMFCVFCSFLDVSNNPHHLAIVAYHFPCGIVPEVKKHGNAKVMLK